MGYRDQLHAIVDHLCRTQQRPADLQRVHYARACSLD
jgi:hypothetical protein